MEPLEPLHSPGLLEPPHSLEPVGPLHSLEPLEPLHSQEPPEPLHSPEPMQSLYTASTEPRHSLDRATAENLKMTPEKFDGNYQRGKHVKIHFFGLGKARALSKAKTERPRLASEAIPTLE